MTRFAIALLVCGGWFAVASAQDEKPKAPKVPQVLLSDQHKKMVKVGVGQEFPDFTLPQADQPAGEAQPLDNQLGTDATVVAVWHHDGAMAKALLRDLSLDIAKQVEAKPGEKPQVATLAIATGTPAAEAIAQSTSAKYTGPVLLDESGEAFEQLGTQRLPRVYVLDSKGQVVWLDIEYSLSTRREMKQAVAALVKKPAE
ncbi:peroxiredoxin family protein [Aeoliella sp.]|uniref:peroxiredoxin family protein n=1 Tax=Aeoliella sp. TaxID=2795800 RepID=UPI003CCB88FA